MADKIISSFDQTNLAIRLHDNGDGSYSITTFSAGGGGGGGSGGDVNLTDVGGSAVSLGQKTMAGSIPVVLASDSPGGGDVNLVEIGGAPLAFGQQTMAGSIPVVLASDSPGAGGGPATIMDGADVTQGALADAAVTTDAAGTVSGKLRGFIALLVNLLSRWPASLGQKADAASLPVSLSTENMAALETIQVGNFPASQPVSGTVEITNDAGNAIPVSAASLPLPAGAATEATLLAESAKLPATLGQKAMAASLAVSIASDQSAVPVSAAALPLPTGAATSALQTSEATLVGAVTEAAPASDTASSGLNGRLQRIAQNITTLIGKLPSSLGKKTQAASLAVTLASDDDSFALLGGLTETAPATDTAASGLNGRLQRIAQRLTSMIALIPTSLGQKTMAGSLAVVVASDQSALPVSSASLPLPAGAATEATLLAESAKLPATLGQKAMTASMAVVLASDQSAVPISAAALPLPTGAATQTTQASVLSTLGDIFGVLDGGAVSVDGSTVAVSSVGGTVTVNTELPAAALLTDTTTNPTTTTVGTIPLVMNSVGSFDRVRGAYADALGAGGLMGAGNMAWDGSSTWNRVRSGLVAVQTTFLGLLNTISMLRYNATPPTFADGNVGPLQGDVNGNLKVAVQAGTAYAGQVGAGLLTNSIYNGSTALTPKFAFANVAASATDTALVALVSAKKIRVLQLYALAGATATNLTLNSKPAGAGVAISALFANGANGGEILPFSPIGWFETVSGEGLSVTTGAGSTTGIGVVYVEV